MTTRQKLLIFLTLVLGVLIFLAPHLPSGKKEKADREEKDFSELFSSARKNATPGNEAVFASLEKKLASARAENTEEAWIAAADEFLRAARSIAENKELFYKGAVSGYESALGLNPVNLPAKTKLGTAMVEGASYLNIAPMTGISLLREVVEKDTANIAAHLQLGLFSLTSHQFEKALDRFSKILKIDSSQTDMHIYLGDTYLQMGEKDKAIEHFEIYKLKSKDASAAREVDEYIKKLKTTN